MARIVDFFGAQRAPIQHAPQPRLVRLVENQGATLEEDPTINQAQQLALNMGEVNHGQHGEPRVVEHSMPREVEQPRVMMVNRDQDADEVVH